VKLKVNLVSSSFFIFLIISSHVISQDYDKVNIYLGGCIIISGRPQDFRANFPFGSGSKAGIGYSFTPNLSVQFSVEYFVFHLNDSFFNSRKEMDEDLSGGEASFRIFQGNMKYIFINNPTSAKPYIIAGLGFSNTFLPDIVHTYLNRSESSYSTFISPGYQANDFTASLGVGVDIPIIESISVYFELTYHVVYTMDFNDSFVPIKGGISIGF